MKPYTRLKSNENISKLGGGGDKSDNNKKVKMHEYFQLCESTSSYAGLLKAMHDLFKLCRTTLSNAGLLQVMQDYFKLCRTTF